MITQQKLKEYREAAMLAAQLKLEQAKAQVHADKLETELLAQVNAGEKTQRGRLAAVLVVSKRRCPAWKQAYIDALGDVAAARVTADTPEKTSYSLEITAA